MDHTVQAARRPLADRCDTSLAAADIPPVQVHPTWLLLLPFPDEITDGLSYRLAVMPWQSCWTGTLRI